MANRVVLVTGASTGLGFAIAKAYHAAGARVVLVGRHRDSLEQAASRLLDPSSVMVAPADVTDRSALDRIVEDILTRFQRLDILVNNAGMGMIAPFEQCQPEDIRTLFETNFFGVINATQAVLPVFQHQHAGHIVNIASVGGLRGIPNIAVYSASKAAVLALSDALRIETHAAGIAITVVCTGRISDTEFFDKAKTYGPVKLYQVLNPLTPADVADIVLDATRKRKRLVIVPAMARWLYRVNQIFPALIDNFLHQRMPR